MALSINQQLLELLKRSERFLIVVPKLLNIDALASALALKRSLEKLQKKVDVLCEGWTSELRKSFGFLKGHEQILSQLPSSRMFTIAIDIKRTPIAEVSYDVQGDTLRMFLKPKSGEITKDEIRVDASPYPYDTLFVLGAADLDSVGDVVHQHAGLFYHTPLVNIDVGTENEHFGQWPLVDVTASSIAEIVFRMHEIFGRNLIDPDTATLILTGMIAATRSFAQPSVTPATLQLASELITLGAQRQEIIHHLYWKRSVGSLKLFGKVLARLQEDRERGLIWSTVTMDDLIETAQPRETIADIAAELFHVSAQARVFLLLSPLDTNTVEAMVLSRRAHLGELLKPYLPFGNPHHMTIKIANPSLRAVEKELVEYMKEKMTKLEPLPTPLPS